MHCRSGDSRGDNVAGGSATHPRGGFRWAGRGRLLRLAAVFVLLLAGDFAYAHGLAIYVSTPVTPPLGFGWVTPLLAAILVVLNVALIRFLLSKTWATAILGSLGAVALFMVVFCLLGFFAARAHTGPPPGLGFPHPVFWGFGWECVGDLFVEWNLYGIVFLVSSLVAILALAVILSDTVLCGYWKAAVPLGICLGIPALGFALFLATQIFTPMLPVIMAAALLLLPTVRGLLRKGRTWVFIGANSGVYIAMLVPFVWTGAFSHGWGGGYVAWPCEDNLKALHRALVLYTHAHEGRLPIAASTDELKVQLAPYLDDTKPRGRHGIWICPLAAVYENTPPSYTWNADLSGATLGKARAAVKEGRTPLIRCSYHEHWSDHLYDAEAALRKERKK